MSLVIYFFVLILINTKITYLYKSNGHLFNINEVFSSFFKNNLFYFSLYCSIYLGEAREVVPVEPYLVS